MSAAEHAVKRLFTVEEANQRLPLVRVIVQDIVELFRDIRERRERLTSVRRLRGEKTAPGRLYSEELDQIEDEIRKDEERLSGYIGELAELGVEFKDPVIGLVDFPAVINDRVVYLCWKLGEPEVQFWHELDTGFAGRQDVTDPSLFKSLTEEPDVTG